MSVLDQGIKSPVLGVKLVCGSYILLDGFKRFRAAKLVSHPSIPFESLADNEAGGMTELLRRSNAMRLHVLEQAALIECLVEEHGLTLGQIGSRLDKSKAWVSLRRRILEAMSPKVRDKLFKDEFPAYAYMHVVQPFTRVNEATPEEVEKFVLSTSGNNLSVRDIERLAYGYFKGPPEFKAQIDAGQIAWALKRSQGLFRTKSADCSAIELSVLRDLELFSHGMRRLCEGLDDERLKDPSFFCQANLLVGGIIGKLPGFSEFLGGFYDRSRAP